MRYGTAEQKEYFLPRILAGDLHFSIGYSEPGSGTDLASLKTRAVQEGDEWVINGQKMWTSRSSSTPTGSGWRAAPTRTCPATGACR